MSVIDQAGSAGWAKEIVVLRVLLEMSRPAHFRSGTGPHSLPAAHESIIALGGASVLASYAASKAGVVNLTRSLAVEWARHGIRVNALCPGYFETDINRETLQGPAGEVMRKKIPQRRFGQLHELTGPLLLLASDASSHMTGATLVVDGGQHAVI